MKKIFSTAIALTLLLGFYSCDKNDDNQDYTKIAGEYKGASLVMTMNGAEVELSADKAVKIAGASESTMSITLPKDILLGEDEVTFSNIMITKSADCTFTGKNENPFRKYTVTGNTKKGVLTLALNQELTSPVIGKWNLKFVDQMPEILFDIESSDPRGVDLWGQGFFVPNEDASDFLESMISGILAEQVQSVQVEFTNKSQMGITYQKPGEEPVVLPEGIVSYFVQPAADDTPLLYIAVDKALIESLIGGSGIEIDFSKIPSIKETCGKLALPLKAKIDANGMTAYVDKAMMAPFLPIIQGLVTSIVPEGLLGLVNGVLNAMNNTVKCDIGLVVEKAK